MQLSHSLCKESQPFPGRVFKIQNIGCEFASNGNWAKLEQIHSKGRVNQGNGEKHNLSAEYGGIMVVWRCSEWFFYKNNGKMQFSLCKYLGSKIFFANLVR